MPHMSVLAEPDADVMLGHWFTFCNTERFDTTDNTVSKIKVERYEIKEINLLLAVCTTVSLLTKSGPCRKRHSRHRGLTAT